MGKLMKIKEASQESGLSEYSIRALIKQGLLPFIKVGIRGGKFLIDSDQFNVALKEIANSNMTAQRVDYKPNIAGYGQLRRVYA